MAARRFAWILVALCLAVLGAASGADSPKGTKWALLVGVADYESEEVNDLKYTVADVKAVASSLVKHAGFPARNVFTMTSDLPASDPSRPTNVNVVARLAALTKQIRPEDTFVFYFSGHGFSRPDGHYLGTVNANAGSVEALEVSTVPVSTLQKLMKGVQARQVAFIIDACRNDPAAGKGAGDNVLSRGFTRDLQLAAQAAAGGIAGTAVLMACSEGERAYEWPEKGQGVFTYYLLEALAGKGVEAGRLTLTAIAEHVQQSVLAWSVRQNKSQRPDLQQYGAARLVLAEVATPAAASVTGTSPALAVGTTARIRVTSSPAGARIFVDEQDTGKVTPADVDVNLGIARRKQVEVGIQLPGHGDQVRVVSVERGALVPVAVQLKPGGKAPSPAGPRPDDGAKPERRGKEIVLLPFTSNFPVAGLRSPAELAAEAAVTDVLRKANLPLVINTSRVKEAVTSASKTGTARYQEIADRLNLRWVVDGKLDLYVGLNQGPPSRGTAMSGPEVRISVYDAQERRLVQELGGTGSGPAAGAKPDDEELLLHARRAAAQAIVTFVLKLEELSAD